MSGAIHLISSSDEESEGDLDLMSRINKKISKTSGSQESTSSITSTISLSPHPKIGTYSSKTSVDTEDNVYPTEVWSGMHSLTNMENNSENESSDDELPNIENFTLLPDDGNGIDEQLSPSSTCTDDLTLQKSCASSLNSVASSQKSRASSLNSGASSLNSHASSISSQLPIGRTLSAKEKKEIERERKKLEREAKREEKERMKREKANERRIKRAAMPAECQKYMVVKLDEALLELPETSELVERFSALELKYELVKMVVPNSITYYRTDPLTGEERDEKEVIVILSVDDFIEQVYNQIYSENNNTLCSNCHRWKMETNGSNVTLVVFGLENFYRKQKNLTQKNYREHVLGEASQPPKRKRKNDHLMTKKVSRIDIETALVSAQIEQNVNVRIFRTSPKLADFVVQVAKAIAERPHKLDKREHEFAWFAEGSSSNCVKVEKSGEGLVKLWHQQVTQFSNVGSETASAITNLYPSPQSLIQAYRSMSPADGAKLLAGIPVRRGVGVLANTRKVGIELSKRVYKYFNETDPTVNI